MPASEEPIQLACAMLVDRAGRVLIQLRDGNAPNWPNVWAVPGGHMEPGEVPSETAVRELWEETSLRADADLNLFERQELTAPSRVKYYFCGPTSAAQDDVVLGEGVAMVFTAPDELLDGRPYTPGTLEVLQRFLRSETYRELVAFTSKA